MSKFFKPLIVLLASFVFFHFTPSLAEEVNQNATKERREELQKQLDNLDSQIGALDSIIQQKRTESASLERDIAIFDAKIKKAKLEIQRRDAEISKTKTGISQKSEQIITLSAKSEKKKDSLAELIRKNNEMDSTGLAEIVLGNQKTDGKRKRRFDGISSRTGSVKDGAGNGKKKIGRQRSREKEFIKNQQRSGRWLSGNNGFEAKRRS